MSALKRSQRWGALGVVGAMAAGLLAGWIDFNNDEPQAAAIVLALCAAILGFIWPARAWLWAVIVGLGIPAAYFIWPALGFTPKSLPEPNVAASLLALIPAFVGAYGGVFVRKVASTP